MAVARDVTVAKIVVEARFVDAPASNTPFASSTTAPRPIRPGAPCSTRGRETSAVGIARISLVVEPDSPTTASVSMSLQTAVALVLKSGEWMTFADVAAEIA
jgi:hypothetical protein